LGITAVLLTRDPGRFRLRAPHLAGDPAMELLAGDAVGSDWPEGSFPLVVHAATERHFQPDAARPGGIFDANIAATRHVLEMARDRGTVRLLFTSSGAVYGTQPPSLTHISEEYAGAPATTDPAAAYANSKRAGEFLCASYAQACGFTASIARLFTFAGPYLPLNENFAVGNFVRDALAGGPLRIGGDGTPYRSYLYGADLAIWLWTILLRGKSAYPYNVGSAEAVSIRELAERVARAAAPGAAVQVAGKPVPGAPAARYVPAVSRAESELGLRVRVPLDEGIRRMAAWHQDH